MSRLILIKHAMPVVTDGVTPAEWPLSDAGRAAAAQLAPRLAGHGILRVLTSREPKAFETGAILAAGLGVPCTEWPGLHEHDRSGITSLDTKADFEAKARALFARGDELVWGRETAAAAHARFRAAVEAALAAHAGGLAVVAHGTVIALFVAALSGRDGFALWQGFGLPSWVVLERPGLRVLELVESLAG